MAISTSTVCDPASRARSAVRRPVRRAWAGERSNPWICSASARDCDRPCSAPRSWSSRTSSSRCWSWRRLSSTGHWASRTSTQSGGSPSGAGSSGAALVRTGGRTSWTSSVSERSAQTRLPAGVVATPHWRESIATMASPRPVVPWSSQSTEPAAAASARASTASAPTGPSSSTATRTPPSLRVSCTCMNVAPAWSAALPASSLATSSPASASWERPHAARASTTNRRAPGTLAASAASRTESPPRSPAMGAGYG